MAWRTRDGKTSEPSGGRGTTNLAGSGVVLSEAARGRQAQARIAAMTPDERVAAITKAFFTPDEDD